MALFILHIKINIMASLIETNLHPLPDVLKVMLKYLLLLCHYSASRVGCLAILQENKKYQIIESTLFPNNNILF